MTNRARYGYLTPGQLNLGYRVAMNNGRLELWLGDEVVATCSPTVIPGVIREAAARDALFRWSRKGVLNVEHTGADKFGRDNI